MTKTLLIFWFLAFMALLFLAFTAFLYLAYRMHKNARGPIWMRKAWTDMEPHLIELRSESSGLWRAAGPSAKRQWLRVWRWKRTTIVVSLVVAVAVILLLSFRKIGGYSALTFSVTTIILALFLAVTTIVLIFLSGLCWQYNALIQKEQGKQEKADLVEHRARFKKARDILAVVCLVLSLLTIMQMVGIFERLQDKFAGLRESFSFSKPDFSGWIAFAYRNVTLIILCTAILLWIIIRKKRAGGSGKTQGGGHGGGHAPAAHAAVGGSGSTATLELMGLACLIGIIVIAAMVTTYHSVDEVQRANLALGVGAQDGFLVAPLDSEVSLFVNVGMTCKNEPVDPNRKVWVRREGQTPFLDWKNNPTNNIETVSGSTTIWFRSAEDVPVVVEYHIYPQQR